MRSSSFYLSPVHNVTKGSITGKDKWKTLARVGLHVNSHVVGYEWLLLLMFVGECSADVMFHFSVTIAGRSHAYLRWGRRGRNKPERGGVVMMCVWMGTAGVVELPFGLCLCNYEVCSGDFCRWCEVPWL